MKSEWQLLPTSNSVKFRLYDEWTLYHYTTSPEEFMTSCNSQLIRKSTEKELVDEIDGIKKKAKGKIEKHELIPMTYWGKKPVYSAKVGTGPSNLILVNKKRKFFVGQRIKFCELSNVKGMRVGTTPPWSGGIIDDIQGYMLFVSRH